MGEVADEIREFIENLKKDYDIERVIFFGSRTRKDYLESSDFDVIVVSKDFEDVFFCGQDIKNVQILEVVEVSGSLVLHS